MIIRIVKMGFEEKYISEFKSLFEASKTVIRNQEGCEHLELWQDTTCPSTFMTYSIWQSESHLNKYRDSDFFQSTWTKTKSMFSEKPVAWSLNQLFK